MATSPTLLDYAFSMFVEPVRSIPGPETWLAWAGVPDAPVHHITAGDERGAGSVRNANLAGSNRVIAKPVEPPAEVLAARAELKGWIQNNLAGAQEQRAVAVSALKEFLETSKDEMKGKGEYTSLQHQALEHDVKVMDQRIARLDHAQGLVRKGEWGKALDAVVAGDKGLVEGQRESMKLKVDAIKSAVNFDRQQVSSNMALVKKYDGIAMELTNARGALDRGERLDVAMRSIGGALTALMTGDIKASAAQAAGAMGYDGGKSIEGNVSGWMRTLAGFIVNPVTAIPGAGGLMGGKYRTDLARQEKYLTARLEQLNGAMRSLDQGAEALRRPASAENLLRAQLSFEAMNIHLSGESLGRIRVDLTVQAARGDEVGGTGLHRATDLSIRRQGVLAELEGQVTGSRPMDEQALSAARTALGDIHTKTQSLYAATALWTNLQDSRESVSGNMGRWIGQWGSWKTLDHDAETFVSAVYDGRSAEKAGGEVLLKRLENRTAWGEVATQAVVAVAALGLGTATTLTMTGTRFLAVEGTKAVVGGLMNWGIANVISVGSGEGMLDLNRSALEFARGATAMPIMSGIQRSGLLPALTNLTRPGEKIAGLLVGRIGITSTAAAEGMLTREGVKLAGRVVLGGLGALDVAVDVGMMGLLQKVSAPVVGTIVGMANAGTGGLVSDAGERGIAGAATTAIGFLTIFHTPTGVERMTERVRQESVANPIPSDLVFVTATKAEYADKLMAGTIAFGGSDGVWIARPENYKGLNSPETIARKAALYKPTADGHFALEPSRAEKLILIRLKEPTAIASPLDLSVQGGGPRRPEFAEGAGTLRGASEWLIPKFEKNDGNVEILGVFSPKDVDHRGWNKALADGRKAAGEGIKGPGFGDPLPTRLVVKSNNVDEALGMVKTFKATKEEATIRVTPETLEAQNGALLMEGGDVRTAKGVSAYHQANAEVLLTAKGAAQEELGRVRGKTDVHKAERTVVEKSKQAHEVELAQAKIEHQEALQNKIKVQGELEFTQTGSKGAQDGPTELVAQSNKGGHDGARTPTLKEAVGSDYYEVPQGKGGAPEGSGGLGADKTKAQRPELGQAENRRPPSEPRNSGTESVGKENGTGLQRDGSESRGFGEGLARYGQRERQASQRERQASQRERQASQRERQAAQRVQDIKGVIFKEGKQVKSLTKRIDRLEIQGRGLEKEVSNLDGGRLRHLAGADRAQAVAKAWEKDPTRQGSNVKLLIDFSAAEHPLRPGTVLETSLVRGLERMTGRNYGTGVVHQTARVARGIEVEVMAQSAGQMSDPSTASQKSLYRFDVDGTTGKVVVTDLRQGKEGANLWATLDEMGIGERKAPGRVVVGSKEDALSLAQTHWNANRRGETPRVWNESTYNQAVERALSKGIETPGVTESFAGVAASIPDLMNNALSGMGEHLGRAVARGLHMDSEISLRKEGISNVIKTGPPARSVGAAAKTYFADPATATYEYVRPQEAVVKPTSQEPTLNRSRAPPAFGATMPDDLGFKNGRPLKKDEVQINYGPARNRSTPEPLTSSPLKKAVPDGQNLITETAKATPSTRLTQQVIHGVKGVICESPPLIPEIAKTFEHQTYTPIVLQETLTVYRAEGSMFGRWFGLEKPDSAGVAERLYNIVDFGNDVMEVWIYEVPKGSVVYVGKVAGGEGHQVFIPNPKKVGVSLKETENLPQLGH